MFYITQVVQVN